MTHRWIALLILVPACTLQAVPTTTGPSPATTVATTLPPSTEPSTVPSTTTTTVVAEPVSYVVVAEEERGRLAVLGIAPDTAACPAEPDLSAPGQTCGPLELLGEVEVPPGPHNLAAYRNVVLATHFQNGLVSRFDLASGEVASAPVGIEPHDVKFAEDGSAAFVADEAGERLLIFDPSTLEVKAEVPVPGEAHDLILIGDEAWVTMVGRQELARVRGDSVELFPTGRSPHDLVADPDGRIWFSNWGSPELDIFDRTSGEVTEAPAGVEEPHHFAIGPEGRVWVSDNGGAAVVGFGPEGAISVRVGPVPHHIGFLGELLVVAVSGTGTVVVVEGERVVGAVPLGGRLHGVAVATLEDGILQIH
jgi:DNA-binding beta-propeller fold protein YncE